jgi:hypothetical protein
MTGSLLEKSLNSWPGLGEYALPQYVLIFIAKSAQYGTNRITFRKCR